MHLLVLVNTFAALVAQIHLYVFVRKLFNKRRKCAYRTLEVPDPGASCPSIPPIGAGYDVFLSFRGVDTRKSFTDYLYCGLVNAGIRVFRDDDEVHAGEKIGSDLLEAIENSKILIPIISLNYASSQWCLHGLVHMMKCNKRFGNIVLPIFYKVESEDVRQQSGGFGEAFHYYGRRFDQKVVEEWKEALRDVSSSLLGWESEKDANGHEGELVKLVVRNVLNELKKAMELVFNDYLVGIDSYVEEVMELVNKSSRATSCVGIYGMGGIGKTTLVRVIYNKLSNLFEHRCFIADIVESCKHKGIKHLQNQLIYDILKRNIQLYDKDEGIEFISSEFKDKKVLILLDDVDMNNQLEALAGNPSWFAPGSRIFVTTRNESVLDRAGVDIKYEHKEMNEEQSLILFSRHAFRRDSPPSEFLALSRLVVSIMGGFPLVLEIVGSFLCGKQPSLWRDTIEKMQNVPHRAVREKLRMCYEELEEDQGQMFLDIACFLIGSDARVASYMWDACGFYTRVGIEVLRSLSFINIGDNHEFRVQNQMRDLGREIVHEENYEPHKRSRLWNNEEALKVLEGNKGTEKIQAICLGKGNSTRIANKDDSGYINDQGSRIFTGEQFSNLPSLRFLHMSDVNLIGDYNKIFSQLKWLKWGNCSPTFAANNFHARELVILDLSGSLISDDWCGWSSIMMAKKLKVLNLTGCHSLKSTSYLSAFKRLEILILTDCCELEQINPCIGDLETLVSLDLSGCSCLKELPPQMGKLEQLKELLLNQTMIQKIPSSIISSLKKLETLSAKDCELLLGLPDSIGRLVNLSTLVLSGCVALAAIPDSIGFLVNLQCLSLRRCRLLRKIPNSIGKLKLLTRLDLSGCSRLEELPCQMGQLELLKELLLDQTMIREIPSSIGSLRKLETLSAKDCGLLMGLPDSIGSLVNLSTLVLSSCFVLAELPDSIGFLVNLRCLSLRHCDQLREIPSSIGKLKLLTQLDLRGCLRLQELPPQMGALEQLEELLLDQTMIREIPSSIGSLTKLEKLSANNCVLLVGLPDSIGRLVNLSTLVLSGCVALEAIPDSIGVLVNLRCLSLRNCHRLREIPISIGKLKLLTQLDLSGCLPQMAKLEQLKKRPPHQLKKRPLKKPEMLSAKDLKLLLIPDSSSLVAVSLGRFHPLGEIPDSVAALQSLITLDLTGCRLGGVERLERLRKLDLRCMDSLPKLEMLSLQCSSLGCCHRLRKILNSIGMFDFLTKLNLSGCSHLEELPPQMGELEQLKELILGQTMIREIPSSIGSLTKLDTLSARDCELLVGLPDSIGHLVSLSTLVLSGCVELAALPNSIGCLVTLRCLSLGRCHRLREIPNSIGKLELLTQLDLSWTMIKELPESIGDLQNLEVLDISRSSIGKLPDGIGRLKELEWLNAKDCKLLLELPDSIGRLVKLRCLSLRRCHRLREIPNSIWKLELLTRFDFSWKMIKELSESIGDMQNLKVLDIGHSCIEKLPDGIGRLKQLEMLSAEDCKLLLELPDSIGHLVNLRCLSLRRCQQLREIPHSIGKLELLIELDLSWTMIKELPESIGDLQNLKVLDISHSSIEKLPDGIGRLKELEMLSAEDCKLLLELPDSIGCLVNLWCLSLGHCRRLKKIPNSIGKLELLTQLYLSWTMITELPESIGDLPNLVVLDIDHSSIEKLPDGIGRLKKL